MIRSRLTSTYLGINLRSILIQEKYKFKAKELENIDKISFGFITRFRNKWQKSCKHDVVFQIRASLIRVITDSQSCIMKYWKLL